MNNAAGDKIAFSAFEKDGRSVYVSAPGGPPARVCDGCLRATGWSRDDKTILIFAGDPYQIDGAGCRFISGRNFETSELQLVVWPILAGQSLDKFHRTKPAGSGAHRHRSAKSAETGSRERLDHNIGRNVRRLG